MRKNSALKPHVTLYDKSSMNLLGQNEVKSIDALTSWVANEQNVHHKTVGAIVKTKFGVDDIKRLKQIDYDCIIKFLVDLRVTELLH